MPFGVDYGEYERRIAIAIAELSSGGGGGGTASSVTIKDGDSAVLLNLDAEGRIAIANFPATQPISGSVNVSNFPATQPVSGSVSVTNFPSFALESTLSGINAKLAALDNSRVPVYRLELARQQTFTIASGATQSDWFAINSDSKLALLEVPTMTGSALTVRWRHPAGSGTGNLVVDPTNNPFTLTIGGSGRTFSSDAIAPLARCFLGDGEIAWVSNLAEGAARSIKLYY